MSALHHLRQQLKTLKLSGMLDAIETRVAQAEDGQLGYLDFLELLLDDEIARRARNSLSARIGRAHFDEVKTFEMFDFRADSGLPSQQLRDLATCRFLETHACVLICGPVGVGKTHVAQALGVEASIRRMGDVEFVADLLIGVLDGPQAGNVQTLDNYYEELDENLEDAPELATASRRFGRTLDIVQDALPDIRATRWSNKSDFYSLFVALAYLLSLRTLPDEDIEALGETLQSFAEKIAARQKDEAAKVPDQVVQYVNGLARGSSDKARRGARHQALLNTIAHHFRARRRAASGRPRDPVAMAKT